MHFPEDDYAQWLANRVDGVWEMPSSIVAERDTVRYQPAGFHDFMPAILDVTGVERPGDRRGPVPGPPDQMGGALRLARVLLRRTRAVYTPENGTQFLVDESTKYVWNTVTGDEPLFNLMKDSGKTEDLSDDPAHRPASVDTSDTRRPAGRP